jgi:hypothetical protein
MTYEAIMTKKSIENTEQRRDQGGRFLTGNIGGPGRRVGSRNKFSQQYVEDFYEVWQQEGKSALIRAARQSPARYIAVAAALIPQHFKVEQEHTIAGLSVEELRERLLEARGKLLDSGIDPELLAIPLPAPRAK